MNTFVFAFDFDGTLVDSYSCLPDVYRSIAKELGLRNDLIDKFVKRAISYEDYFDLIGNYDRKSWWKKLLAEFEIRVDDIDDLLRKYWIERAKRTKVFDESKEILEELKGMGFTIISLCASDGMQGMKRMRIKMSSLLNYFNEILIVGEDVKDRSVAIEIIKNKYKIKPSDIVVIDDKPGVINEVKSLGVKTVKVDFNGILKLAWQGHCDPDYRIKNINELKDVVKSLLKG